MAARMAEVKGKEGQAHLAAAKKALSTGVFKWNPDLQAAAAEYEKAGTCFRNAKDHARATAAYRDAADCKYKLDLMHHAGALLEQAATCAKDGGDVARCGVLYEQAASYFRENGNGDKAADTLIKGAAAVADARPEQALEYYEKAVDTLGATDKPHACAPALRGALAVHAAAQRWPAVLSTLRTQIDAFGTNDTLAHERHKACLGLIVVHLLQNDAVAADRAFTEFSGGPFFMSDEGQVANDMLDAFRQGAPDILERAKKQYATRNLDVAMARLARSLQLPGGAAAVARYTSNASANANNASAAAAPAPTYTPAPATTTTTTTTPGSATAPPTSSASAAAPPPAAAPAAVAPAAVAPAVAAAAAPGAGWADDAGGGDDVDLC